MKNIITLSYQKNENLLSLNFPYQDFGIQHFTFSIPDFLNAYNSNKKEPSKVLKSLYKNVPPFFDELILNPSIIKRVVSHKGKFYLPLSKKVQSFAPRGIHQKKWTPSFAPQDEINQIVYNMNIAVKKAAISQDLVHFNQFKDNFLELLIALGKKPQNSTLSKKQEKQSFLTFQKKVESMKKILYNH